MPRYNVEYPISGLEVDGKPQRITRGVVDIAEAQAAPLLAVGALSVRNAEQLDTAPAKSQAGAPAVDGASADVSGDELGGDHPDARVNALHTYLAGLLAGGEGKPRVAAAKAATGIDDLTGAEITQAWVQLVS